eukprot:jgi/Chrzof1/15216/Cz09g31280.t1
MTAGSHEASGPYVRQPRTVSGEHHGPWSRHSTAAVYHHNDSSAAAAMAANICPISLECKVRPRPSLDVHDDAQQPLRGASGPTCDLLCVESASDMQGLAAMSVRSKDTATVATASSNDAVTVTVMNAVTGESATADLIGPDGRLQISRLMTCEDAPTYEPAGSRQGRSRSLLQRMKSSRATSTTSSSQAVAAPGLQATADGAAADSPAGKALGSQQNTVLQLTAAQLALKQACL